MHEKSAAEMAETILVVEDEILIRMVICDYLRDCGYRIFEAGTTDEAIQVLHAEPRIDVVFTDIQMPGDRNGFDLCRWVHSHMPNVKVILTSGGMKAADVAEDLCYAGPLMGKPYHLHQVVARVRSVLERGVDLAATG